MINKRMVRRRGGFADRNNIVPISKEMQFTKFDDKTRVKLKNLSFKIIDSYINYYGYFEGRKMVSSLFADKLFCISTRASDFEFNNIEKLVNNVFDRGEYDEILDTVEFITTNLNIIEYNNDSHTRSNYCDEYNNLFEEEYVGYRFVNGFIVNITTKEEIESINEASTSKYKVVNQHISNAVTLISESGSKDYAKSIKESIAALETLCLIITGENKVDLDTTFNFITKECDLNPMLRDVVVKLFDFVSNKSGTKQENTKGEKEYKFEDAKFVLVVCSAIINYLIGLTANKK